MALPTRRWRDGAGIGHVIRLAVVTMVATSAVIAVVVVLTHVTGASFGEFSRDPTAVLNGHVYIGYLSNLGVLIWSVGASAPLVAAAALARTPAARLLTVGGALTALMVVDDMFLLHDRVLTTVGIPQPAVAIFYAVLTAAFAWHYRRQLGSALLLIGAACAFWGLSAAFDAVLDSGETQVFEVAVEDGAKFIGIGLWTVMLVRQTIIEIRKALVSAATIPGQAAPARPAGSPPTRSAGPGRHRHRDEPGPGPLPTPPVQASVEG